MRFGEKVRRLREARGLSRQQLADLCGKGVSLQAITQWELGLREPLWAAVQTLARVLEVSCTELTDDVEPSPEATEPRRPGRPRKGSEDDTQEGEE